MNESTILLNHMKDLADKSYSHNMYTYSRFLPMSELSDFYRHEKEFTFVGYTCFGGYEDSERRIVRFGSPEILMYTEDYPINVVKIVHMNGKNTEELTHRDYLGALMNLGVDRSVLGDILTGEGSAFVFVLSSMADYICENLNKVKHTYCRAEIINQISEDIIHQQKSIIIQVSSPRVDACIARVFHLSREAAAALFPAGRVYINGRSCTGISRSVVEGDRITVRGYGRFQFAGIVSESRKGKLNIEILI